MKQYYECHVTMETDPSNPASRLEIEDLVRRLKWKFSAIDGDPVLGSGVKCYATKHYNAEFAQQDIVARVHSVSMFLQEQGVKVTRDKVELVVYDSKTFKLEDITHE